MAVLFTLESSSALNAYMQWKMHVPVYVFLFSLLHVRTFRTRNCFKPMIMEMIALGDDDGCGVLLGSFSGTTVVVYEFKKGPHGICSLFQRNFANSVRAYI